MHAHCFSFLCFYSLTNFNSPMYHWVVPELSIMNSYTFIYVFPICFHSLEQDLPLSCSIRGRCLVMNSPLFLLDPHSLTHCYEFSSDEPALHGVFSVIFFLHIPLKTLSLSLLLFLKFQHLGGTQFCGSSQK